MKAGDDMGKPYRKYLLDHDPIQERNNRFANRVLLAVSIYLFGNIVYVLYN